MVVATGAAGPRPLAHSRPMRDVLVLCYHAVSEQWPSELAVRPDDLERQVAHLLGRGYAPVTVSEAVLRPRPGRVLAVTFDDGYASMHSRALPVLRALGVPATLYVPTGYMGADAPMTWAGIEDWVLSEHRDELCPLGWEQIAELRDAGWEIGSHTVSHPFLTQVPDDRLREELEASREQLARRLGEPCTSLAYPYGDVDGRVVAAARAAGYASAVTLPSRLPGRPRALEWPRLMVGREDSPAAFRRHVSRGYRHLLASPAWPLAAEMWRFARGWGGSRLPDRG